MKKCKKCGLMLSKKMFYLDKRGVYSSNCKSCPHLSKRKCVVCDKEFMGRSSTKACSKECHDTFRPQTFKDCEHCGKRFGPLSHLKIKFCSYKCKCDAQSIGISTIYKPTRKARNAQRLVKYYVDKGDIIRPSACQQCGRSDRRIEAAHYDYEAVLDVRWLCKVCHVKWDKETPKGGAVKIDLAKRIKNPYPRDRKGSA